ncbi:fibronectin type III domain-containing protein isoform X1 [Hydra vulgaris]
MIILKLIWGLLLLCYNSICQDTNIGTGVTGVVSNQEGLPPRVHQLIILDSVPIENVLGQDVLKLECTASGNPVPKIEWSFNNVKFVPGQPFNGIENAPIRHTIQGGKLTITNIKGKSEFDNNNYDTGRYRCIATNEIGTVFAEIFINVRVMGVFSPGFQFENEPTKHRPVIGQKFIVPCPNHKKGYGTTIRWGTVSNERVIDYWLPGYNPRVFQTSNGALVFSVVLEDDIKESRNSGGPRCILMNYGLTRFSNQQVLYESYDNKQETRKPELLALLDPQMIAPIESTYSMICGALGFPVPTYRWEYQGVELVPLRPGGNELNFEFFEFLPNRLELRIRRVTQYSGGTFKCYASNSLGEIWTIGQLSVAFPPVFNIFFPDEINVPFENAFEIRCNASGFPVPKFEWYHNSTQLSVKDARRSWTENTDNQGSVLSFTKMAFSDNGIYICIAINSQDTITQSTFIKVRAMAPLFEIPVEDPIYLFRTADMMIHCSPSAGPIPTFTWSKDNVVIADGGRYTVYSNGTLLIKGVLATDSGLYKCSAENPLGKAESQGTAIVLEPTVITHPPISQGHQIGFYGIQLFCGASWDTRLELRIEWYKGGVRMAKFDDRIYIEKRSAGPPRILYINNLTIDDAGNYSCHAFTKVGNVVSEQTAFAILTVRGPPQPPAGVRVTGNCGNYDALIQWTRGEELGAETRGFSVEFSTNVTAANGIWYGGIGDFLNPNQLYHAYPGTRISFKLTRENLVPGANLIFRLKGYSDMLMGNPSRPSKSGQCITPPGPPPMNPLNVTGITKMMPGVLFISWTAITDVYYGAPDFFYEVGFRLVGAPSFTVNQIRDLNVTEFQIPTPGINKEYEFYVQSKNSLGEGPPYKTVTAFSGKEPPLLPPKNFKVASITRHIIDFTWTKADNAEGYRLKYWNVTDAEDLRGRLRRAITDPIVYNYQYFYGNDFQSGGSLVNMSAQLTFLATISSYNSGGFSPESDVISFESDARVPDAPYGVQFRVFGRSAHISWQPPLNPNGYIEQYEITWENSQLELLGLPPVVVKTERMSVDRRSREAYLINMFVPLTYYGVRINARNRIGPGGDWEKILVAVSEDDIPGKPNAPKAVSFDDTSINVTFQLPNYGGLPSMFYIFYRPRGNYFKEVKNVSQLFPQQAWVLVKELQFVPYDFWTVGVNSMGQSETSDVTEQRPIRALKPEAHASQFPWYRSNWFIAVGLCLLFITITLLTLIFLLRTGPVPYKSLKEESDYKGGYPSGGAKAKSKTKAPIVAAVGAAAFSAADDEDNPPPRYSDQDSISKKSPATSRSGSEGSRSGSRSQSDEELSKSESESGSEYSDEEKGSYYSDEEKKKDSDDDDDDAEDTTFV